MGSKVSINTPPWSFASPHHVLAIDTLGISKWPAFVTHNGTDVGPTCRERLVYAKGVLERIHEVSCGLWKQTRVLTNRTPVKYMFVEVQSTSEYLTRVHIFPLNSRCAEYMGEDGVKTVFKLRLGCPVCRSIAWLYANHLRGEPGWIVP